MRPRPLWPGVAACIAVLVLALTGCGETGGSTQAPSTATPASSTTDNAPAVETQSAPDYGIQAERAVRVYYRAIDGSDFSAAWGRLTPEVRSAFGGYAKWRSGFDTSVSTRVTSAVASDATSASAEVAVGLKSVDVDACGSRVTQRFGGVWQLERSGGRWRAAHVVMRKTAGKTPVLDVTTCPGAATDSGDVCDPTSAVYDQVACDDQTGPSDSGDPCDPNSVSYDPSSCYDPGTGGGSFCDSHTCIDNFDEGTGYIVQCNDGEWSQSGGRPGACSYHGGESDVTAP